MNGRRKFWHWPPPRQLAYAIGLAAAVLIWFGVIYGGAAFLTDQHRYRVRLHTAVDLAIPLVPWMAVVYMSLYVLQLSAIFILRTMRELEAMAATFAVATLIGGVIFVLLPAANVFPAASAVELDALGGVYRLARWLALPYNFLPSLHVAFATICVLIYCRQATAVGKLLLCGWGLAIIAATLLIHEHYLIDVAGGLILGWATVRWVYRPWLARRPAIPTAETPLANPSQPPRPSV